jgi:hypothetical protein
MVRAVLTNKWVLIALVSISFILMAYQWLDVPKHDYISIEEKVANPVNIHMIDSGIHMLQQGDIVVRTGNDITSTMFLKMNQTDKTYSHCGIVMMENGYPFIYHSIGGEDNPDETLRRDSASFWFSPRHNMGFGILRFNFTSAQADSLKHIVRQYYAAKKKFDLNFDLRDDCKLYCAEFVYNAINYAMADTGFIKTTRWMGKEYVAIDNFTLNPNAHLICQVRYK